MIDIYNVHLSYIEKGAYINPSKIRELRPQASRRPTDKGTAIGGPQKIHVL